jgi:hypothetical protein
MIIENLISQTSQLSPFVTNTYTSYKYLAKLRCYLFLEITNTEARLSTFLSNGTLGPTQVVARFKDHEWTTNIELNLVNWLNTELVRSQSTLNNELKAYVITETLNLEGIDACKWFQTKYKELATRENRILAARLYAKHHRLDDTQVFKLAKDGSIAGVALPQSVIMDYLLILLTPKDLIGYHCPSKGVFYRKKR